MRFTEFLRVSVLLSGAAGTALGALTIVGIAREGDTVLGLAAVGWWVGAALAGLWLGRRPEPTPGIARLLASARTTTSLPELEPGAVLFNRLWPLAVLTVAAGVGGIFFPQVAGIATGYAVLVALTWRRQSSAVAAVEDRDGVRFYFDRTSPFGAPRLLRTPGFRKVEPPAYMRDEEPVRL